MRAKRLIPILSGWLPVLSLASVGGVVSTGGVEQGQIITGASTYTYVANEGFRVNLPQRLSHFGVNLQGVDWTNYTHIQVSISNNRPTTTLVEVAVDSGTSGWAWSDFVIAGNATRTVTIPLQKTSLAGLVTLPFTDPSGVQAEMAGTIVKNNMRQVRVWNVLKSESQDLTVKEITAVNLVSQTSAAIDQYGQRNAAYPGRITSDADLANQWTLDNQLSGILPYSSDVYGGVAGTATGTAPGRWKTAKQNGKWFILTPAGNRFFSTGIVNVGNGAIAYTQGREALFAPGALPSTTGSLSGAWFDLVNPSNGQPIKGFSFYRSNLIRKYGSNWANVADDVITRRLRTWGFNTVGPTSWGNLYQSGQQMANMQEVAISGNFRTLNTPGGSTTMPDPYDPAWATAVSNTLTPLVNQLNQSLYNAGLFVDNELPWARHWQEANYRYDLAFNVLSSPSNQPAKQRFYRNMTTKYRTIQQLNAAWGTTFSSWTTFLNNTNFRPNNPTASLARDMQDFLTQMATQYFSTIKNKLTALNYKGLYLGCRFAYVTPEVLTTAARYCDVVSLNVYDISPNQWHAEFKSLNAPVMISEFAFGSSDRGRMAGGAPCGATETDRVAGYNRYVNEMSGWTNLVGMHWYKWEDDPLSGRMWDGQTHALGLVTIADVPYPELVNAATAANTQFNQRLLTP